MAEMDLDVIHGFLTGSYWAEGRSKEEVRQSMEHSMCFALMSNQGELVGFARVITDRTVFGYLADVFVLPEHRGNGLSKRLMKHITQHPQLQEVKRMMLATDDAHGLYKQFGFTELADPARYMAN